MVLPKLKPRKSLGVLFVLLSMKKAPPPFSKSEFEKFVSGSSARGSLRSYFAEVSGQKLDIKGVVTDWIPFNAPVPAYQDKPKEWFRLLWDVLWAESRRVDLTSLDGDGDGEVDLVMFVHDTVGAEMTGSQTGIWSATWNFSSVGPKFTSYRTTSDAQAVTIDDFSLISGIGIDGKIAPIGPFVHQIGHTLGLEGQYSTTFKFDEAAGAAGAWSLMGNGWSWDQPPHLSGPEKLLLGWVDKVDGANGDVTLPPVETSRRVIVFPLGGPEYLFLENRQRKGFDAGLPGAGLLVWRLLGSKARLVEADGRLDIANSYNNGEASDAFPTAGSDKVTVGNVTIRNIRRSPNGDIAMHLERAHQ